MEITYTTNEQENGVVFINSTSYEFDAVEDSISGAFISPKLPGVVQIRDRYRLSHGRAQALIERMKAGGGIPAGAKRVLFESGRSYDLD